MTTDATSSPVEQEAAKAVALFDGLAELILHLYNRGRAVVAVDGADGKATRRFADSLAAQMRAQDTITFRTGMSDLLVLDGMTGPADANTGEALYRGPIDYPRLRDDFISGFRKGDYLPATAAADQSAPDRAILIVDGRFLLRPELRGSWNYRIWLEGGPDLSAESLEAQLLYVRDNNPREDADAVFDITDPGLPRRVWGDSC